RKMESQGGLLSEFRHDAGFVPANFPRRNRIVAGLSDATIVVEASKTGGALITAELAGSYNRDVFALPGRLADEYSEGCLYLIKSHKAQLITGAEDVAWYLGWENKKEAPGKARETLSELEGEEKAVARLLAKSDEILIDELLFHSGMPREKLISVLLNLEIKGVIQQIPGKGYKISIKLLLFSSVFIYFTVTDK
ncbi:MAG TPA: DNA-processing protein DprA, partial [Anseongella sp.]|nr:DNA-processing protein DprA [Anseongella sp.]